MTNIKPIPDAPHRVRQRKRNDGSWRIWWEPERAVREMGFASVDLSDNRLSWSVREAEKLNAQVKAARGSAKCSARAPGGRTVARLVQSYIDSPRFTHQLKPATQRDYTSAFGLILKKWASERVVLIDRPMMVSWYGALLKVRGKHAALSILRKMSILMTHAMRIGWRDDNPCTNLGMLAPQPRDRVVSWDEYDRLIAAASQVGRLSVADAISLSFLQGQRQTDILACKVADFEGDIWRLIRSKRSTAGAMDLHPEVLPILARHRVRNWPALELIINEYTGRPYARDNFVKAFAQVRAAAAEKLPQMTDIQFRDLRRSFGVYSRLGGVTERDTADALGNKAHKDPKLSLTYMPPSYETASRAVRAVQRPDPEEERKKG